MTTPHDFNSTTLTSRGSDLKIFFSRFLTITFFIAAESLATPKKLTCEHIEDVATNWTGSKTTPVDVLFTAVFDPDDLILDNPTYEYTLVKWKPRTEKRVTGMSTYIGHLSIGPTYVQPMKATATTLILDDYKMKAGLAQPVGLYKIGVSRSDLTYTIDLGHRETTGQCKIEDLKLENVF